MARYRCNAIYPGTQTADLRVIPPGVEFEVPDDEPPRTMWLPLDSAAKDAFVRWNREHPDMPRKPNPFVLAHLPDYLKGIDPNRPQGATSPRSRNEALAGGAEPALPGENE